MTHQNKEQGQNLDSDPELSMYGSSYAIYEPRIEDYNVLQLLYLNYYFVNYCQGAQVSVETRLKLLVPEGAARHTGLIIRILRLKIPPPEGAA